MLRQVAAFTGEALALGSECVVETRRGQELGTVLIADAQSAE
ncbi:MAG: hypothetical protein R3F62_28765 [Planctomycetota bacterium]